MLPEARPVGASSSDTSPGSVSDASTEAFARRLAVALRRYGTPSHRLEDHMATFAARVGLPAQFYVLPSAILVAVEGRTYLMPMLVGAPALEKLVAVDALAEEVASGRTSADGGLERIEAIEVAPSRYGQAVRWAAPALVSAAAVPLFGGGARELGVAVLVATMCVAVGRAFSRRRALERLVDVAAGALAAWIVHAAAFSLGGTLASEIALICGILVLLPGLTLTVAFTELATRHLISGTTGLVAGTLTLLQLGFGVAMGEQVASAMFGPVASSVPSAFPAWVVVPSVLVIGAGLTVDLQARPRDLWHVTVAVAVAVAGAELGGAVLGSLGGAFGAFALTAVSHGLSRRYDRPAAVTQLPGILLLVPGSVGFRSVSALQSHDVVAGVATAFQMAIAALGLVVGILLATALVPPRRAL